MRNSFTNTRWVPSRPRPADGSVLLRASVGRLQLTPRDLLSLPAGGRSRRAGCAFWRQTGARGRAVARRIDPAILSTRYFSVVALDGQRRQPLNVIRELPQSTRQSIPQQNHLSSPFVNRVRCEDTTPREAFDAVHENNVSGRTHDY